MSHMAERGTLPSFPFHNMTVGLSQNQTFNELQQNLSSRMKPRPFESDGYR